MIIDSLDGGPRSDAPSIRHVRGALLRAPGPGDHDGTTLASGVFTQTGKRVTEAETVTFAGRLSLDCPPPDPGKARRRTGHWLFGGLVFNHFGHAFIYSLARLWAIERLRTQGVALDGILYFQRGPRDPGLPPHFGPRMGAALKVFNPDLPLDTVCDQERVEHLYVPDQGISTTPDLFAGIPDHHAFMRRHGRAGATDAPEVDLYISRTKTGPTKGNHILEDVIERHMAAAGYQIYHPQADGLADQIATYQRARRIVGVDGSAFHVAATAVAPTARIAILSRRAFFAEAMARQVRAFSGAEVHTIRAYCEVYSHERGLGKDSQWYRTLVLTDFDLLGQRLVDLGFLDRAPDWKAPKRDRLEARLGRWGTRLGTTFLRVPDEMLVSEPGAEFDRS